MKSGDDVRNVARLRLQSKTQMIRITAKITTEIEIKLKGRLGLAWEHLVGHGDRYERAGLLRNIFGDLGLWRGVQSLSFFGDGMSVVTV